MVAKTLARVVVNARVAPYNPLAVPSFGRRLNIRRRRKKSGQLSCTLSPLSLAIGSARAGEEESVLPCACREEGYWDQPDLESKAQFMLGGLCALLLALLLDSLQKEPSPCYVVEPVSGKGLGCVAMRDIVVGELIVSEAPLFVVSQRASWLKQLSDSASADKLDAQVDRLSSAQQKGFWALASNGGSSALDVFRTNAYPAGPETAGIFPAISRLNSACVPNVHNAWDPQRRVSSVRAVRPIPRGAELLNCYIGLYLPFAERQRYLQTHFGFACGCAACSLGEAERQESDGRRVRLQSLRDAMRALSQVAGEEKVEVEGEDRGTRVEGAGRAEVLRGLRCERATLLRAEGLDNPGTLLEGYLDCLPPPSSSRPSASAEERARPCRLSRAELAEALQWAELSKGNASPEAERLRALAA